MKVLQKTWHQPTATDCRNILCGVSTAIICWLSCLWYSWAAWVWAQGQLRSKSCARRICHEWETLSGSCVLKPGSRKKDSKLYRNYSAMRQHDVENQQHGISHFQQVLKFSENIKSSQLNLHAPFTSGSSVTDWGTFPSGSSVTDWPWHFSSTARTTGEVMLPGGNLARAVKWCFGFFI